MLLSRDEKRQYDLEQICTLIDKQDGIVKTSEIEELGVDYRRILSFVDEGTLIRVKSGYYSSKYYKCSEEQWIKRLYPDGILSLESGLYAHGYLKEQPTTWSVAIDKNTSKSRFKIEYPIVKPLYTEPDVLEVGVTTVDLNGVQMRVYTKERLICDCLKYQEKLDRVDFRRGVFGYIEDETKDIAALMEMAAIRKVTSKVNNIIGVWL